VFLFSFSHCLWSSFSFPVCGVATVTILLRLSHSSPLISAPLPFSFLSSSPVTDFLFCFVVVALSLFPLLTHPPSTFPIQSKRRLRRLNFYSSYDKLKRAAQKYHHYMRGAAAHITSPFLVSLAFSFSTPSLSLRRTPPLLFILLLLLLPHILLCWLLCLVPSVVLSPFNSLSPSP